LFTKRQKKKQGTNSNKQSSPSYTKQNTSIQQQQETTVNQENENKKRTRETDVEPVKGKKKRKNPKREGDRVRCVCDDDTDEGLMIQCEVCQNWLHCDCLDMQEEDIPERYTCSFCQKEASNISREKIEFANLLCDISSLGNPAEQSEKKNVMDKPNIARWKERSKVDNNKTSQTEKSSTATHKTETVNFVQSVKQTNGRDG